MKFHDIYCTVFIFNWQTKRSISFFTSVISIFIFRSINPQTQDYNYYYFADLPTDPRSFSQLAVQQNVNLPSPN